MAGRRRKGRDVHGIVLLDKRTGISSNAALQEVKRLYHANKAGHTGSLDPLASGLLPVCLGEATKVSAYLLDTDKRYRAVIRLGITTSSGDSEGEVIARAPVPAFSTADIEQCLQKFTGLIEQVPPMYSALKHQGKRLYELARAGTTVARSARQVRIFDLRLIAFADDLLTIEVLCSKGTYIRTLAEDIGAYLRCGGSIVALRRLQAGPFQIADAMTIEQWRQAGEGERLQGLLPADQALTAWPALHLNAAQAAFIGHGRTVPVLGQELSGKVRVYDADNKFLALGEVTQDQLVPVRVFNFEVVP